MYLRFNVSCFWYHFYNVLRMNSCFEYGDDFSLGRLWVCLFVTLLLRPQSTQTHSMVWWWPGDRAEGAENERNDKWKTCSIQTTKPAYSYFFLFPLSAFDLFFFCLPFRFCHTSWDWRLENQRVAHSMKWHMKQPDNSSTYSYSFVVCSLIYLF